MSSPLISVLMPVYNAERYVAEAVESILGQTFRDFEFIIIDDGSTDRSLEILQRYAQQDPRIRLSSRPNMGLAKTLNEGLALARGEFIARMDADDVSLPGRFARQIDYLSEHEECVAVGTQVLYVEPYGSPLWVSDLPLTHEEIDTALLARQCGLVHPSFLMRSHAIQSIGGYSERCGLCEDHELFLRLAERGRIANMPEVLYKYRKHLDSITIGRSRELARDVDEIVRNAWVRRSGSVPADVEAALQAKPPPPSKSRILRTWAWASLRDGNLPAARRHALGCLWRAPLSWSSWNLMYCALRGR